MTEEGIRKLYLHLVFQHESAIDTLFRNTLEFLRQWENDINENFDDRACEELIHQGRTTALALRRLCGFEKLILV